MSPVDHVEAALERLTLQDIAALPPARRSRFRELLWHWHMLASPKPAEPSAGDETFVNRNGRAVPAFSDGVLDELKGGRQS
jgi:hypothetical protein